jgi:hypothetical protein
VPELTRHVAVLIDMAGCPNRCRHCWLGAERNRRLPPEALRQVAGEFRAWRRPGAAEPYFQQVDVASWYREPDFAPNYRELHQMEKELSDDNVSRFELLSIWRLARDPSYASWAREVGTEACQITFFGPEETTDWFTRRPGSFRDSLLATERLIEAGIRPRWQIILTRRFLPEAAAFVDLVRSLALEERVAQAGGEFAVFLNTPSPDGEAWQIEDLRPRRQDLADLPEYLVAKTLKHFGAGTLEECLGRPEAELLPELRGRTEPPASLPGVLPEWPAFRVSSGFDVYTNLGETAPWWRLGNLWQDGLDEIIRRYEADEVPGLQALFRVPVGELAERYGRPEGERLYSPSDLITRWIRLWAQGVGG